MTEQHSSPNLLIDIWKTLRDMSQQMGVLIGATTATGEKVDGLDDRLQQVEKCVQQIPALEGRVVVLEGKIGKAANGSKKRLPTWERVALWTLLAVCVGAVLILGYVNLVAPALAGLKP